MGRDEIISFIFRNPVSAGTHLLWCVLGMYITALLWKLSRGDRVRQLSTGAFGLSMVLLYGASCTYHAIPASYEWSVALFRKLDHSAIYVLIAGTGTPVFTVLLRGRVMRIVPRPNEDVNETWIADRDRFSYQGIYSEDRILKPMVRDNGMWQESDLETALNLVAASWYEAEIQAGNDAAALTPLRDAAIARLEQRLADPRHRSWLETA